LSESGFTGLKDFQDVIDLLSETTTDLL